MCIYHLANLANAINLNIFFIVFAPPFVKLLNVTELKTMSLICRLRKTSRKGLLLIFSKETDSK